MATVTTCQLGNYNPLTDSFTSELDINDRVTYFVDEVKTPQPKKQTVEVWNIRTVGARYVKQQHESREITVTLAVTASTVPLLLTALQNLQSQVEGMSVGVNPKYASTPAVLKLQAPNATAARYSLVQLTAHTIDYAVKEIISSPAKLGGKKRISLVFTCYPFSFSIPRQWLANGVNNPGFEAPSGLGVTVFSDAFANNNAYAVQSGSAPSVASNVMTIPAAGRVSFGSPAWGPINTWQIRFQWVTSMTEARFYLHYTDANNYLAVAIQSTGMFLIHTVTGTAHTLASPTYSALTTGNWYWLRMTQFPTVNGNAPQAQAILFNDSAGSIGSQIQQAGPATTFDAVSALVGAPQITCSGAALPIGGNFTGVHQMSLFGPGGWLFSGNGGTGDASGAWDGPRTEYGMSGVAAGMGTVGVQTYPNGPVTSFGSARIELPPAGTVSASWSPYIGGTPAGSPAIPVQTVGNTIQASAWVRTNNLNANAIVYLIGVEYDNTGTQLRFTVVQQRAGNQTGNMWVQLSGSWATGANCAYISFTCRVDDTVVAGESANATVWFDNVQCWDQTRTGMTSMPYCELRFPQSPAQLMVSGLLGTVPSVALTATGIYFAALNTTQTATLWLGRRASMTTDLTLLAPSFGGGNALDSAQWAGYSVLANPGELLTRASSDAGTYRLLVRAKTANSSPTGVTIGTDVFDFVVASTGLINFTNAIAQIIGRVQGTSVSPFKTQNAWIVTDIGAVYVPPIGLDGLTDTTQVGVAVSSTSGGAGGSQLTAGVVALIPADGGMVEAAITNPSNGSNLTTTWLYIYAFTLSDLVTSALLTASRETTPIPNAAHGMAAAANTGTPFGPVIVNPVADPYHLLDPTLSGGVNQFGVMAADNNGLLLPTATEFIYQPQYNWPF